MLKSYVLYFISNLFKKFSSTLNDNNLKKMFSLNLLLILGGVFLLLTFVFIALLMGISEIMILLFILVLVVFVAVMYLYAFYKSHKIISEKLQNKKIFVYSFYFYLLGSIILSILALALIFVSSLLELPITLGLDLYNAVIAFLIYKEFKKVQERIENTRKINV